MLVPTSNLIRLTVWWIDGQEVARMDGISHQQLDDVQDAIDIAALIEAAVVVYPAVAEQSGVSACAHDVIVDIACDRHPNESVAEFRENPAAFLRSGKMVDIGPVTAASFAVLIAALDSVAETGFALDELLGKRT